MIDEKFLKKMSREQLDQEFNNDIIVMKNYFSSKSVIFMIAGVNPEQAIDDLFGEMKQIWLQRLSLELKGGE